MNKRRPLPLTTLGPAMRASLQAAQDAGCTPAELRTLHAVHIHTISWGKLEDRASTGQIAVTAGHWDGDPSECPDWIRRKVGSRLQALARAGAITYNPGGGGGWRSSRVALPLPTPPQGSEGTPSEDTLPTPSEGTPGYPVAGTPPYPGRVGKGTPGESGGLPPDGYPPRKSFQGSSPVRGREALRSALRAVLAPALRDELGRAGVDGTLAICLKHITPEELQTFLEELADDGDEYATLQRFWSVVELCGPGDTTWAHIHTLGGDS